MSEMTWRQMRILTGKARSTCYCTDQPKYARCRTCPWFEVGVNIGERWRDTSDLARELSIDNARRGGLK